MSDAERLQRDRETGGDALSGPGPGGDIDALLSRGLISAALQPIVRLSDDAVIGYEALARFPPSAAVPDADSLFATATALGVRTSVDLACARVALAAAHHLAGADLFVNVVAATLLERGGVEGVTRAVGEAQVSPSGVVLELCMREPVADPARLRRITAELRGHGFRLAVDGAGAGNASMRAVAEVRPEFIKVDPSSVRGVDSDEGRRALILALLSFSGNIGARFIAVGVETAAERAALGSLGVQFAQGLLLGAPVLTRPVAGHAETPVVDDAWFARHSVALAGPRPIPRPVPPAPEPAPPPHRGSRRGLAHALSDAAMALQSEHDPMRILSAIADHMGRVVPVKEMAIYVADHETHRLVPVLAIGPDREAILAMSHSLDEGITGWALAEGSPQNVPDTFEHPRARHVPGTPHVAESMLLAPLVAGDHKLGIVACWRAGIGRFSPRDLEAASLFAHIAAAAWRNAQLYMELLDAAMTDPLTRVYNSRWLRDTAQRDLQRASRSNRPFALLLLDLDHFKAVNDSAGHAAGDLLLQRAATTLRTGVRGTDAVVRIGGEEFVVLLHDVDARTATSVAEALRGTLHEVPLPPGCPGPRLTVSIGVAAYPSDGEDLDQLLAAADRAMYQAKHGGRDRVVVAGGEAFAAPVVVLPRDRAPRSRRA